MKNRIVKQIILWVLLMGLTIAGCGGSLVFAENTDDNSERTVDKTVLAEAGVWSTVTVGAYEQDADTGNGTEPIKWIVLAKEDDKVLLISLCALDVKPYHETEEEVTWENCSLREWLNSDFYNAAFSPAEQDCILTADVTADVNPDYDTDPGQDTQDKVFLLSAAEAQDLFGIGKMYNDSRKCEATAYAIENHADTSKSGNTFWWLRSPGCVTSGSSSSKAAYVDTGGQVQTLGEDVDNGRQIAVRPVIWVSIAD